MVRPLGGPEGADVLTGRSVRAVGGVAVHDTAMNRAMATAVAERTVTRA